MSRLIIRHKHRQTIDCDARNIIITIVTKRQTQAETIVTDNTPQKQHHKRYTSICNRDEGFIARGPHLTHGRPCCQASRPPQTLAAGNCASNVRPGTRLRLCVWVCVCVFVFVCVCVYLCVSVCSGLGGV